MPVSTPLAADEVHVWLLRADQVTDPEHIRRLEALLAPSERERYDNFGHPRARREYLLARGLARTVLAGYTGVPPQGICFTTDAFGKPLLFAPANDRLHFNLSHSHGVVGCAVALDRQVGIDIEDGSRAVEFLELAERYFAAAEFAHLRKLQGAELQTAFFAIWTLKEAFVKAIGLGLRFPLETFSFELEGIRLVRFHPPPTLPGKWRFEQFRPNATHLGALAVECNGMEVRVVMRDFDATTR